MGGVKGIGVAVGVGPAGDGLGGGVLGIEIFDGLGGVVGVDVTAELERGNAVGAALGLTPAAGPASWLQERANIAVTARSSRALMVVELRPSLIVTKGA